MKKKLLLLLTCLSACIAIIVLFYHLSYKINHRANGFVRLFPPHVIYPIQFYDLTYNSYYIAGATSKTVYFGNYTTLNYLLACSFDFKDTSSIRLNFQGDAHMIKGSAKIIVDSPNIYFIDGRMPLMLHANFYDLLPRKLPHDSTTYFISAIPLSPASAIIKVFNRQLHESIMAKENFSDSQISYAPKILEKQLDGLFSTDGSINTARGSAYMVYVYHYRNQFVCLDTNLNILYKGRTIDTISHAQIKLASIKSDETTTFADPPLTVNQHSSINDKWILVHSLLRANNEVKEEFEKYSVIDVYSLKDGLYHFSFYLPDLYGKKVRDFRIFDKTIVALYGKYAYTFQINF